MTNNTGGIHIGGNASDNVMVTGNNNHINKTTHNITTNSTGLSIDEIAKAFAKIEAKANEEKDKAKKKDSLYAVEQLKDEAELGENATESRVKHWFNFLAEASSDVWEVAITTLSNPMLGLGTAFKKITEHAKEEKAKK